MHETTADAGIVATTVSPESPRSDRVKILWDFLLPAVICLVFLLPFLGRPLLEDWDEAIYAEIAREFVNGASWLVPHWNFQPWFEKPPLLEWITASFFTWFGVSQFWARAASAFAGAGTVLIAYALSRRLAGRRAAWITVAVLLTTFDFYVRVRSGNTDSLLTFFMYVSLYGLLLIADKDRNGWYAFWCGLGLGIMTKSAAMTPVILTALFVVVKNRRILWKPGRSFWYGLIVFLLIVVPWHVYMAIHFGKPFLNDYIGRHVLERSFHVLEKHAGGPWFYLDILTGRSFWPWVLVLPLAILHVVWRRRMFLTEWFAVIVFCFYTVVRTKLWWYILPMYPALAITVGYELHQALRRFEWVIPGFVFAVLVWGFYALTPFGQPDTPGGPDIALIRQNDTRSIPGALILCSDRGIMESPGFLFYSHRKVEQAYVFALPTAVLGGRAIDPNGIDPRTKDPKYYNPIPLSQLLGPAPVLAIIDARLVNRLPSTVRFSRIAGNADYELGTVARAR